MMDKVRATIFCGGVSDDVSFDDVTPDMLRDVVWSLGWKRGQPPPKWTPSEPHVLNADDICTLDIASCRMALLRKYREKHPYLSVERSRGAVSQLLRVVAMMIPAYNYEAQKEMTVDEYKQMCDTVADVQVCSNIIDADKSNAELEARLDSWERSLGRDQEASRVI
jgi:hypothetical protein